MIAADFSVRQAERIRVNGYDIDVRRGGQTGAPVILLVHGIGVSSRYFLSLARELADDFDVVALDLPGYGTTPRPRRVLSIPELAEILAGYVKQEGMDKVVVVGHSMGCQIVAHFARRQPELCAKMVLLGPTVNKWERVWLLQAWRLLQDIFHEPVSVSALIFRDYLRMGFLRYIVTLRFMMKDHIETTLQGSVVPILFIRGEKDTIVPMYWLRYLSEQVASATLHEITNAPHALQLKKPRTLSNIITDFISGA